jgi:hypothetical protein
MPKSLICDAAPLLPSVPAPFRSLGSAIIMLFCHKKGTHVLRRFIALLHTFSKKSRLFVKPVVPISANPASCRQLTGSVK